MHILFKESLTFAIKFVLNVYIMETQEEAQMDTQTKWQF